MASFCLVNDLQPFLTSFVPSIAPRMLRLKDMAAKLLKLYYWSRNGTLSIHLLVVD
jgi:hypothetical protein